MDLDVRLQGLLLNSCLLSEIEKLDLDGKIGASGKIRGRSRILP